MPRSAMMASQPLAGAPLATVKVVRLALWVNDPPLRSGSSCSAAFEVRGASTQERTKLRTLGSR